MVSHTSGYADCWKVQLRAGGLTSPPAGDFPTWQRIQNPEPPPGDYQGRIIIAYRLG